MTKVILLNELRAFTIEYTRTLLLPVAKQAGDQEELSPRAAEVYCMRLPDSRAAKKKAPYILHQIMDGKDVQAAGRVCRAMATVRTIFCVYHPDEQEGGLALLNLMEQLRIALLEKVVVGKQFCLDLEAGAEAFIYPEDSAPYYSGEMTTVWRLPPVVRLDAERVAHGLPPHDHTSAVSSITLKGGDPFGKKTI